MAIIFTGVEKTEYAGPGFAKTVLHLNFPGLSLPVVVVALRMEQNSLFKIKKVRPLKRSLKTSSTVTGSLYTIFMRISVRLRRHALKQ